MFSTCHCRGVFVWWNVQRFWRWVLFCFTRSGASSTLTAVVIVVIISQSLSSWCTWRSPALSVYTRVVSGLISRDHSFPRNAEYWAEPRNLPIFADVFAEFCGIRYWPVIYGTNMAYFGEVQAAVLYVYMISPWNTWLRLRLWREE